MIVDLDSRNGINFRGEKIKEKKLEVGDEILVGKATLIFEKELPKPYSSPNGPSMMPPAGLAAEEFITQAPRHLLSVLFRVFIGIAIIGIIMGYGYIKLQERASLNVNIISKGASFEQPAQPPNLPNGWQLPAETKARITVTDREFQDGKYSLLVEKTAQNSEFCTEIVHSSIIKVPAYVKLNPKEIYTFGGWVKSDQFKKSLSGYKISWFDDAHRLIRNDYTEFVGGTKEWRILTAQSNPPPEASYGRFSCMILGVETLVYLDNVSVLQFRSGVSLNTVGKINKAVLDNQSFKLTVFQSGIWELEQTRSMGELELNGELVFKPHGRAESRQSFYNHSRILNADSENIRVNAQILNPLSLEMLNINVAGVISQAMTVTYDFPSDLYPALRDRYFSLVSVLPAGNIRHFKLIGESGVKEISLYEKTTEKVAGINIGFPNNIVVVRYLQPVELSVDREGDMLYLKQVFQPLSFSVRADSKLSFGLEFELKPLNQSQSNWVQLMKRAEELENRNNLGEAIELYRSLAIEVDPASDVAQTIQTRLSGLESNARNLLQNVTDLLYTARLLKDFGLYEKTAKLALEASRVYLKTEYGDQAKNISLDIKSEIEQVKNTYERQNAEKILIIADGFAKEKQSILAVWLYEKIIRRYAGTPTAKQAGENLDKLNK
jgi:hypothetical protein